MKETERKQPEQVKKIYGSRCYIAVSTRLNRGEASSARRRVTILPGQGADYLNVEFSKAVRNRYPLGTIFVIKAQLTDREGTDFVYTHYTWPYCCISQETFEKLMAQRKLGFFEQSRVVNLPDFFTYIRELEQAHRKG